jgi:hypothetical protein
VREILEVRDDELATARAEVARLSALLDEERRKVAAMRPVVEAAEAWRDQFTKPADMKPPRMGALIAAVDSYRSRSADPAGEQT